MNNYRSLSTIAFATLLVIAGALMQWECSIEPPAPVAPSTVTKNGSAETPATVSTEYPDLAIDSARLAGSVKFSSKVFKPTDCAVVESCITAGKRRLMRFRRSHSKLRH